MNHPALKTIFPYCLISLVTLGLYGKTLFYGLVYLDDHIFFLDYYWYFKNASHWPQFFTRPDLISNVFYRPLLSMSFMLNALMSGQSLWAYRLTNFGIHAVNSSLLFVIFKNLKFKENVSLVFALIFAVHPALVSANVWIPGRTDSLPALFILIAFIFFLHYCEQGKWKALAGIFVFYICALLSKESAVVFPLICLCFLVCHKKETAILSNQRRKERIALFFLLGIVLGAWFLIRQWVLAKGRLVSISEVLTSIGGNLPALVSYLGKIFIPFNLSTLPILRDLTLVYGVITIGLLAVAFIRIKPKRKGLIFFGIFWFLMFLLPSLVISFLKHEYRLYLPMAGMMIAVLALLDQDTAQRRINGSLLFVLVLFSIINFFHSAHYKDRFTFWNNAVAMSPHSPLAHRNLGAMYFLEGEMEKAEARFLSALELNPTEAMAHNNLALIYQHRGQFRKAEEYYLKEIKINPGYANAYYNLGLLYAKEKQWMKAERSWLKTIELNPKYLDAYRQLAVYYHYWKEYDKAKHYVNQLRIRGVDFTLQQ